MSDKDEITLGKLSGHDKEWLKGTTLGKWMERLEALEKNQMTLNENLNILEDSYAHSMKSITASLERLLRRVKKLEEKLKNK